MNHLELATRIDTLAAELRAHLARSAAPNQIHVELLELVGVWGAAPVTERDSGHDIVADLEYALQSYA